MWLLASGVYWSSLGYLAYTYAGYPLLIQALSRLRPRPVKREPIEPTISVVIPAHNEEAVIGEKLTNLLSLDYPHDRLQIIVVTNGCTDRTEEVVRGFADRGVEQLVLPRGGKPQALNEGVRRARGEVVVLGDARQRLNQDALRVAASFFADPQVGAVTGDLVLETKQGPGVYWAYERLIRIAEARVDSVVGASGCFIAVRRHLYRELPEDILLDDVYLPMQIVLAGYRVLHQPEIQVFDREVSVAGEFSRKARTLAGNFQLLERLPELLDPRRNRILPQFLSHKVLRLGAPLALLSLFASNAVLVATGAPGWPFYLLSLGGQLALYGLAINGALAGERAGKLSRISHTFVVLNAAAVEGFRRYRRGDFSWTTVRHTEAVSSRA